MLALLSAGVLQVSLVRVTHYMVLLEALGAVWCVVVCFYIELYVPDVPVIYS